MAVTDFEPSDARRAFPCLDEPAMKSNFKLTMKRHENFTSSLFNTPLEDGEVMEENDEFGKWFVESFKETVPMSTYLVAFAVSDFKKIEKKTEKGVLVEVSAKAQSIDAGEGKFGLEEAVKVIDFFSDYFDVPYPLAKSSKNILYNHYIFFYKNYLYSKI